MKISVNRPRHNNKTLKNLVKSTQYKNLAKLTKMEKLERQNQPGQDWDVQHSWFGPNLVEPRIG